MKRNKFNHIKGKENGWCNRRACQSPVEVIFFNYSTRKYYCVDCAILLNQENRSDAFRLFGHDLCLNSYGENPDQYFTRQFEETPDVSTHKERLTITKHEADLLDRISDDQYHWGNKKRERFISLQVKGYNFEDAFDIVENHKGVIPKE